MRNKNVADAAITGTIAGLYAYLLLKTGSYIWLLQQSIKDQIAEMIVIWRSTYQVID